MAGREHALEWGLELKCCCEGSKWREHQKLAAILKFKKGPETFNEKSGNFNAKLCDTSHSCFSFVLSFPFKWFKLFLFMLPVMEVGLSKGISVLLYPILTKSCLFNSVHLKNQYNCISTWKRKKNTLNRFLSIDKAWENLLQCWDVTGGNL